MDSGIYKIANIKTGDFYIGSAVKFNLRFNRHKFDLKNQKHYNKMLQNIYNKYGLENLSFEVIEIVKNKDNLIFREQYYLDTLYPRYNICKIAGNCLGRKMSEENKKKLALVNKNNKYRLGHKASKETKIKMSESQKGNKNGLGHKHSTEIRHKISETKTGGKSFKIKSPIGDIYENKYLNEFCSMHNLHPSHLREVINGRRPHHKGWTKC